MPIYVNFSSITGNVIKTENSVMHGMTHGTHTVTPKNVPIMFQYGVEAPRDVSTGQASGKRQHKPITITKEVGASSALLLRACLARSVFPHLALNFESGGSGMPSRPDFTINLTNALLVGVKRSPVPKPHGGHVRNTHELEEIEFTFQKIELQFKSGKSAMKDDWGASG